MTHAARNLWTYAGATLTYQLTRSPFLTALQVAIPHAPAILLARWAGPLVDRTDPRRLIIAVSLVQAVLTLGFLCARSALHLMALTFILACASMILPPVRAALLPQMVGRAGLLRANARLSWIAGAVQLFSPAAAGSLLLLTGPQVAFLFNSLTFLAPAAAMLLVRPVEPNG